MDAKELRIGNYVMFQNEILIVEGIYQNPYGTTWIDVDYESDCEISKCKPVPLTLQRLQIFGFEQKNKNMNRFRYEGNTWLMLELEDGNWDNPSLDVYINGDYITCISSVSQLQNLFFDIAHKEIEQLDPLV